MPAHPPSPLRRVCTPAARVRHVVLGVLLAATASPAGAQDVSLRLDAPPAGGVAYDGYAIGPALGTVTTAGLPAQVTLYCVDVAHDVAVGQTWAAHATPLTAASLADTRDPGGRTRYREAAWLADRYAATPRSAWAGIQAAMWRLFLPGFDDGGAGDAWLAAADAFATSPQFPAYDYGRYTIYTDAAAAGPSASVVQEVIGQPGDHTASAGTVVPEPGTWALTLTGLAGLRAAGRRRAGQRAGQRVGSRNTVAENGGNV